MLTSFRQTQRTLRTRAYELISSSQKEGSEGEGERKAEMGREEKEKRRGEGSKEPEETERWRGGRERERARRVRGEK